MKDKFKCSESCFECSHPDCICNIPGATHWEKRVNRRQREIRQEKEEQRIGTGIGSTMRGTLLIRLR